MIKLNKVVLVTVLTTVTGLAGAGNMCRDFEIGLKNKTADKFLITEANLTNGDYSTSGLGILDTAESKVLTISKAADEKLMKGSFKLHSVSLPIKEVKIIFSLSNTGIHCQVKNFNLEGDYNVIDSRITGRENFTINYK
jgi:hypothetical protein